MKLAGKVALVTGGSRGIGKAIVWDLARQGAKVAFVYNSSAGPAEQLVKDLELDQHEAICMQCDVKDKGAADDVVKQVIDKWERIDILVNNAGGASDLQPIALLSDQAFDEAMKWNLYATFWACRRVVTGMTERGYGRIINISSVEGKVGKPAFGAYTAAKHAVNGLTKCLAQEVGTAGVTVNAICPGLVITDIVKANGPATAKAMGLTFEEMVDLFSQEAAMKRPVTVEEVAGLAVLLASPAGGGITGQAISVDGGTTPY